MNVVLFDCPDCGARFSPANREVCPACGRRLPPADEMPHGPQGGAGSLPARDVDQILSESSAAAESNPRQTIDRLMEELSAGAARVQSGMTPDPRLARTLRDDVLPPLRHDLERMEAVEGQVAMEEHETHAALLESLRLEVAGWEALAEAFEEIDEDKLTRHRELIEESQLRRFAVRAAEETGSDHKTALAMIEFQRSLYKSTPRMFVTQVIVGLNILVAVLMVANGVNFMRPTGEAMLAWGANFAPRTMGGEWWRLVTCMFLHFGILHLGFNMWVLLSLGRIVERLVGNVGFALLYVLSGICASLASLAWKPGVISAGASGAVFGVAGALLGFMVLRRDTVPAATLRQLRGSMAFFLLVNIAFGLSVEGIDNAAHLGGLVAGFAAGLLLSQRLDRDVRTGRTLRNSALVVSGGVLLTLFAVALPEPPPDLFRTIEQVVDTEQRVLELSNDLAGQWQDGEITAEQYADHVESDILPDWTAIRTSLEEVSDLPGTDARRLARVLRYVELRERAWRTQVEGIREQDRQKLERSKELWERAEELAAENMADG